MEEEVIDITNLDSDKAINIGESNKMNIGGQKSANFG